MGSAPAFSQVELRQGSNSPPGTVYHRAWLDFKTRLESTSANAIKVTLNTNEPNEGNLLSNLRRGRIDCAGVSLQGAATVVPEIAVLQLPYLFDSLRQVDYVYGQAPLTETYRKLFAARGLQLVGWVEVGFINMYGVQSLASPADIQGLKLRATQSRASQNFIKAAGAEAVVLPFAELLPGLQTGLIRGGESGVIVYEALLLNTAPHYTLTQHTFDSGVILCNKEWFDKLPAALATQVQGAHDWRALVTAVRAQSERFMKDAAARGVKVHSPNAAEQSQWRAVGRKSAELVMAKLPPEAAKLRQDIQAMVKAAPQ